MDAANHEAHRHPKLSEIPILLTVHTLALLTMAVMIIALSMRIHTLEDQVDELRRPCV
jgi:hypothetical protein